MPSPERAADRERVLARAAEECEGRRGVWFGGGLPQALRTLLDAHGGAAGSTPAEVAFVEVHALSPRGRSKQSGPPDGPPCQVVGLTTASLDELELLFGQDDDAGTQLARLICPDAVFDFIAEGVRIREIRHGLTAADLQRHLPVKLWSGPDLKELGSH